MSVLTQFGAKCREHRNSRRLRMIDQATALGCSVAFVSAVELGEKKLPESYSSRLIQWLKLSDEEGQELQRLADSRSNILHFRPQYPEQAEIARRLFRKISSMSPHEIRRLENRLKRKSPDDE